MTNPHDARHDDPPDEKGVLFCPECDHRSPADGDWEVCADADAYEYRCPDCGASVLRQPIFESELDSQPAPA